MTSLYLLLWIAGAIALQIGLYLSLEFFRHWQELRNLRKLAAGMGGAVLSQAPLASPAATTLAWTGLRTFLVERKEAEDAAGQICSFYLVPEDGKPLPSFLPGQFLTFRLDVPTPTGSTNTVTRCYSLSGAPHRNAYRITIKRAPAPAGSALAPGVSSNYFHDQVQVGSRLQVRAPSGHFHIEHSEAPVVLIGGGVGITPMLSMLDWCVAEQPGREVWLFYGVRDSTELVQRAHLESLTALHPHFHLHLCLSAPQAGEGVHKDHLHHGRVDVALLRRLLPLKPFHFYLCGPTPMLESLVPALEDWGVPDGRIHFEAFGPASVKRRTAATALQAAATAEVPEAGVMVTFAKSRKQLSWQTGSGSLLDLAEANGITVSSGCRAGSCGSCQTRIQSGAVAYSQSPDFDPEPGSCLLCVCTPKTAVTLEA
jgi:ferredoxin-NADP reductase